jgi:hypothetical protein
MRTRRLLLAASALSTLTFGCSKATPNEPPPGNPKGTFYDANIAPPVLDATPVAVDAPREAAPEDAAMPADAARDAPRDAAVRRDAGAAVRAPVPIYANTKGSTYDKGQDPLE